MEQQRILVVGSGGREHAIARKLLESPRVSSVYCAPGNPGMRPSGINTVDIAEDDFAGLKKFALEKNIAWTFVGPENVLVDGLVDYFAESGLKAFGPNRQAAKLEGSKTFAKEFMAKYHISTAAYVQYESASTAISGLAGFSLPVVIKADGLAGGKGVTIAKTFEQGQAAITHVFDSGQYSVLLEENLVGEEYSIFVLVSGTEYVILPTAQDHKRAFDGNRGPNTGGMGAFSINEQLSPEASAEVKQKIVVPTVAGLTKEGFDYHGVVYIGIIETEDGPKVIEYNVRFGDPETQVILPRIKDDFAQLINDGLNGKHLPEVQISSHAVLGVVVASQGYPAAPKTGQLLPKLPQQDGIMVDFANVAQKEGRLFGAGGRLLTVIGLGQNLNDARRLVYDYLQKQHFSDCFYRTDIAVKHSNVSH